MSWFAHALVAAAFGIALLPVTARAQMMGSNLKGDFGCNSGTQAPPGWYVALLTMPFYSTDAVRDRNGDEINLLSNGEVSVTALAPLVVWSSPYKVLGGNYGLMVAPAFVNNALEAPVFGVHEETGLGVGDLYVQPINIGWHKGRMDYIAALGVFAPTGTYEDGASDNTGLGMWSYEISAGFTFHPDTAKAWNIATTAFYETHSKKEDSDAKVGDILTLEGGVGRSFVDGAVNVGAAYYAQWKLTDDDLGTPLPITLGRHHVYGFGPDVTVPIVVKKTFITLVNARYFWETGAASTVEGHSFLLTLTFPLSLVGKPI
jgi:hypothetical protein